jgi:hypothetical protein
MTDLGWSMDKPLLPTGVNSPLKLEIQIDTAKKENYIYKVMNVSAILADLPGS